VLSFFTRVNVLEEGARRMLLYTWVKYLFDFVEHKIDCVKLFEKKISKLTTSIFFLFICLLQQ
jgi:hypothetical protein